jgi:integrase
MGTSKHTKNEWTRRWRNEVKPTRLPNVWLLKEGGHLVRARVKDPTTGRLKEIKRVMPEADELTAFKWLEDERVRMRAGFARAQRPSVHFGDYAVALFEKKSAPGGKIKSSAGRMRWRSTLEHLIAGTEGEKAGKHIQGLGEIFVDKLHANHVDTWKVGIGELIAAGDYAPTTANGWLSILRVIMQAAQREFDLAHRAMDGVEDFDTSEHVTYSEEEPNSLPADRVGEFLEHLRRLHPQHFAMTYLGLITGLRPSSLRPLRRTGAHADVVWSKNRILIRRSQTRGPDVMNTTKQKRRYAIDVPEEAMRVLHWHVDTQLTTPQQQESELLFPSITGGFRAPNVLNKPFAEVTDEMELGYPFTQRGMRRTFNDLARHAKIESIVTRSISGHLTERMQDHYSTVAAEEQRESIAKVIDLFSAQRSTAGTRTITSGAPTAAGGALGGAPTAAGGAPGH